MFQCNSLRYADDNHSKILFSWTPKLPWTVTAATKLKDARSDKPRQRIKKQRHHFADKGPYNQSYGFFQ